MTKINRRNFIPAYYQLADDIKRQIEIGKLKDGDMISTEEQLGELYGISRMTVRHGLSLLAEAGLIETIKGKGTFVHPPRLNQFLIDLPSTADRSEQYRYKLLEVKFVRDNNNRYVQELGLAPNAKVILLKRILYKNDIPVAIENKYLSYLRGTPLLEVQLEYADFPEVVAKHQETVPVRNEMIITVDVITPDQAELLQIEPNVPALMIKQVIYSKDDKPLGISHMVCNKDRFQLKATSYPHF
ncbi:GntR family transcriptional regulator [Sporomusaceae bacterium BoRhaA]|uniref:GntR family transcriptional regulator n=1 Tax=Pelorhabdus rhamnosifermentans TaxID=2772457 RepID=UPI001C060B6E|nr:GntR family transcriptional regulator [Pelorhabdus rhamnosifermentans]MBU2703087.1 GntR family transcriptional regulator [Pelorhabdus rhamnosifermentans]